MHGLGSDDDGDAIKYNWDLTSTTGRLFCGNISSEKPFFYAQVSGTRCHPSVTPPKPNLVTASWPALPTQQHLDRLCMLLL
jgi:hypothetical protein